MTSDNLELMEQMLEDGQWEWKVIEISNRYLIWWEDDICQVTSLGRLGSEIMQLCSTNFVFKLCASIISFNPCLVLLSLSSCHMVTETCPLVKLQNISLLVNHYHCTYFSPLIGFLRFMVK